MQTGPGRQRTGDLILSCALTLGVGCSGDGPPSSPAEEALFLGPAVDPGSWETQPFDAPSTTIELSADELATWRLEGAGPGVIEDGALVFDCQPGGRIRLPEGHELDVRLIDEVLVSVDTGDARGSLFHLEWRSRGAAHRRMVHDRVGGMQTFRVVLRGRPSWEGKLRDFSIVFGVAPGGAKVRLRSVCLTGAFGDLARARAGWEEVSIASQFRPALFATVPSACRIPLQLPAGARLHLGLGVLGRGSRVRFEITVEAAGRSQVVLEETVDSGDGWQDRVVSLAELGGQSVRLSLRARSESPKVAIACWSDPILRVGGPRRPNVFLYLADTLRSDHLEPYGYGLSTPNLTALAKRSIVFENCVAQSNWTKPTVASLLTSTFVSRHGVTSVGLVVPDDVANLAEVLRERGYRTASFVTNRFAGHATGLERGFSTIFDPSWAAAARFDHSRTLPDCVLPWMESHASEPLFVYVHTAEPHMPYEPPEDYRLPSAYSGTVDGTNFRDAARNPEEVRQVISLYDGEVRHMDHSLGTFLDGLEELRLFEPAYFAFTSDHGEAFQEHGQWTHGPFLGLNDSAESDSGSRRAARYGAGLYHHQVDVPLILHLPHDRLGGTRRSDVVRAIDLMPTLLAALDVPRPAAVQGTDLLGHARPGGAISETVIVLRDELVQRELSYRSKDWKAILIVDAEGEEQVEVFRLDDDPRELAPLSEPYPEAAREILAALRRWRDEHPAVLPAQSRASSAVRDVGHLNELREMGYLGDDE